jgi:hypothetical protein
MRSITRHRGASRGEMMKKYRLSYLLLAIVWLLLANFNCKPQTGSKVITKVNGEAITEAEFIKALPGGFVSDSAEKDYRHTLLNQMITKKLFVQEAKKLGLDKEIELVFERDKKTMLIQVLYDDVVTKNVKINPDELEQAKNLMATEVHVKVIVVPDENTARMASEEIKKGVSFDSVAKIFSKHSSAQNGGDVGFVPSLYFEEPVRKVILKMKPNEISEPIRSAEDFKIINYIEKRQSTETEQKLKDNSRMVLEQEKSQKLAKEYLDKMYNRLEYNPEGLKLFYKNVDSITPEEGEIWVVKKDKKKIVKAKNLLHVARQFPVSLDTAMRTYSVKREVDDDMLYEDALARNLDKKPDIAFELKNRKDDLLYEKFYLTEITQKADVTEQEIEDYYNLHKDQYGKSKLAEVSSMIRNTIFSEKRQALYKTNEENLKSKAKIEINEKLYMNANKPKSENKKTGGK